MDGDEAAKQPCPQVVRASLSWIKLSRNTAITVHFFISAPRGTTKN